MEPITPFGRRLRLLFGIYFAILFSTIALSVYTINKEIVHLKWVSHTYEVISSIKNVETDMITVHAEIRGYALTNERYALGEYESAIHKVYLDLLRVRQLTFDNENQQRNVVLLKTAIDNKLKFTNSVLDIMATDNPKKAGEYIKNSDGHELFTRFKYLINLMLEEESGLLVVRQNELQDSTLKVQVLLPSLILLNVGVAVYIYSVITSRIKPDQ